MKSELRRGDLRWMGPNQELVLGFLAEQSDWISTRNLVQLIYPQYDRKLVDQKYYTKVHTALNALVRRGLVEKQYVMDSLRQHCEWRLK